MAGKIFKISKRSDIKVPWNRLNVLKDRIARQLFRRDILIGKEVRHKQDKQAYHPVRLFYNPTNVVIIQRFINIIEIEDNQTIKTAIPEISPKDYYINNAQSYNPVSKVQHCYQ